MVNSSSSHAPLGSSVHHGHACHAQRWNSQPSTELSTAALLAWHPSFLGQHLTHRMLSLKQATCHALNTPVFSYCCLECLSLCIFLNPQFTGHESAETSPSRNNFSLLPIPTRPCPWTTNLPHAASAFCTLTYLISSFKCLVSGSQVSYHTAVMPSRIGPE